MWLVGLGFLRIQAAPPASASHQLLNDFNVPSAIRAAKASSLIELL
jgi:hypothetical protein